LISFRYGGVGISRFGLFGFWGVGLVHFDSNIMFGNIKFSALERKETANGLFEIKYLFSI
jgi:hypothetical protein